MKVKRRKYDVKRYCQELIDRYKSKDNMLKHARYDDETFGYFFIDRKYDDWIGYIAFENDIIIALEVNKKYQGKGYAGRLLKLANSRGADKLTVNKNNENAIEMYNHLGWKTYKKTDKMLFMKKD